MTGTIAGGTLNGSTINGTNINVTDKLIITNGSPTLYLRDTNERSGMIHMNSNRMYFLSGGNNTTDWSQVNGQWPLYLQTDNNAAYFGGYIETPSSILAKGDIQAWGRMTCNHIYIESGDGTRCHIRSGIVHGQYYYSRFTIINGHYHELRSGQASVHWWNNFTGQHRCFIKDIPYIYINKYIGLIVCSDQNTYILMSNKILKGNKAITQDEALPYCSLSCKNYDKSCFGVISSSEAENERLDNYSGFCTVGVKEKGDTRIYINSVGEGAVWVSNKNGSLESGDYITTCDLSGYGMKQDDDILHNYTVAKITMNCDFNPVYQPVPTILKDASGENILDEHNQITWTDLVDSSGNIVYEYEYNIRYLNEYSEIISKEEYDMSGGFIAAYVGCTYHCG